MKYWHQILSVTGSSIMNLASVCLFYSPFTSRHMSHTFQVGEAAFPLYISVFLATVSTMPLAMAPWWILSIGNAIVLSIVNYSIHQALMFGVSERRPDGSYYISASLWGPTQLLAMCSMFVADSTMAMFWLWYTGLLKATQ